MIRFIVLLITMLTSSVYCRDIDFIVVHATDVDKSCGAECIDKIHVARGWDSCGYHYIVMPSGEVQSCRPEDKVGAHTKEYNKNSIGVAWAGHDGDLTSEQIKSLLKTVKDLLIKYNLNKSKVYGHNHFPTSGKKTCPIIDMDKFREELN